MTDENRLSVERLHRLMALVRQADAMHHAVSDVANFLTYTDEMDKAITRCIDLMGMASSLSHAISLEKSGANGGGK
jgi:hypothetical protein